MPSTAALLDRLEDRTVRDVPRVRLARHSDVMTEILRPEVNLTVWERDPPVPVDTLDGFETIRFVAEVEDVSDALCRALASSIERSWHAGLIDDVAMLARRYATIMKLDGVAVRLERIVDDACRMFHADYVAVRLITTYRGRGTEWLEQGVAPEAVLAGDAVPQRLATGDIGLFKGRLLASNAAIVHRSSPVARTGEERLLLAIDPPRAVES